MAKKKKEEVVEQTTEQPKVDNTVEKLKIKKQPKKFNQDSDEPVKVDLSKPPKIEEDEQPVADTETEKVEEKIVEEAANKEETIEQTTEENAETVYQSLQKYIYQSDNNSDGGPDQSKQDKFLNQSFQAAAARDDKGNIIGGSTFSEKIKMTAVDTYIDSKLNPIKSTVLGQIPIIGSIHNALKHAGSNYVDPYYDPAHSSYYTTGFGQYTDKLDRPGLTKDQEVDKLQKAGIDSGTGVEDPSDYLQRVNAQKIQDQFRDLQNINAGGGNGGSGHAGGSAAAEGAASQASDDVAAGAGGY